VASALEPAQSLRTARVFGVDLVLWVDDGGAHALEDHCPHRGARLSLGRVDAAGLQCGYHGWVFAGDGRCVRVPSQPDFRPPDSHRARAWRACERHGLLWVSPGAPAAPPPALDGLPARRLITGPFKVETSAPRLVENFLDVAHFSFVHPGSLGDPDRPAMPDYRVDATDDGRPCVASLRVWQPVASAAAAGAGWVHYRYEVLGPYAALLAKQPDDGSAGDAYALFVQPVEETVSLAWFVQATADTRTADADLRAFQAAVFAQDAPVLESQRPQRLPLDRAAERHSAADRLSTAYRDWLRSTGVTFGTC